MAKLPNQFKSIQERFEKYFKAVENLGKEARAAGPLNKKTAHLVQLAAAAASRSEGAVHSHTRRALEAGAQPSEIYHAIILLTSTVGFPTVSAALCWADDVIQEKAKKK